MAIKIALIMCIALAPLGAQELKMPPKPGSSDGQS